MACFGVTVQVALSVSPLPLRSVPLAVGERHVIVEPVVLSVTGR